MHEWLLADTSEGTQISIKPSQPKRTSSRRSVQGDFYDCHVGKVNKSLVLHMPGIWVWVQNRYVHALFL